MSKYYSLYNNIKLRKGGRKIAKLSETQFVEKTKAFILNVCKDDKYTVEKINNTNASNKIIATLPRAVRQSYYDDNSTIHKDFKDIKPDWENFEISGSLRTVKGCPYIIMYAGGDWECPICIMVYHDGKQFRCYIPEKGNAYRKDVKRLFGNCDPKYDHKSETYTDEWKKGGKTFISDDKYAFDQLVKDGILDKEKDINKLRGLGRNIEFDTKQCIEDFSSRVEPISIKESYQKLNIKKMNVKQKRSLYESIMKSISKTVKNKINEMMDNDHGIDGDDALDSGTFANQDEYIGFKIGEQFMEKAEENPKYYSRIFSYMRRRIFNDVYSDTIKDEYNENHYYTLLDKLAFATKNGLLKPFPDIFINYYNDYCSSSYLEHPPYDFAWSFYNYLLDYSKPFNNEIEKYCSKD